jgi:uncharacterized protein (DUF2126 family)
LLPSVTAGLQKGFAMTDGGDFENAIAAHDATVAALGVDVWVGNEPTFTDRFSNNPEWVTGALGEDKRVRAERLLARMAKGRPGCAVLRSIGRQYPGEPSPRWCLGLYARRDGVALWSGPPDPLLGEPAEAPNLAAFHVGIETSVARHGFRCRPFRGYDDRRLVLARHPGVRLPDPATDARLSRPSIHTAPIPAAGLRDELANDGLLLLIVSSLQEPGGTVACVELPAFDGTESFIALLAGISEAAHASALPSVVLRGFAPPVDASVCWTTVTPDPAVVEINMAPHPNVLEFLRDNRRVYAAAASVGLEPYRLHYNGTVADSGGGGQITFGGPSPERSPFFVHPHLLPRLIRYAARHPSLSYLFAHDSIGGSGQSVRPDEHGLDALGELKLALALIDREPSPTPGLLWRALAPSLTDPVGNSHRAEINIEKLWNPHLPGRGQLGLVEFRAFRMQHTPERAAALVALLRAVLAMLTLRGYDEDLAEWGAALRDRLALPHYLEADLRVILGDLEAAGLPLGPSLREELTADDCRPWSTIEFGAFALTIRCALDFWLLLGDATRQDGTSRLVDASSRRVELALRAKTGTPPGELEALQLRVAGIALPLCTENDDRGAVRVCGLRYRSFVPMPGLHPTLGAQTPLRIFLVDPEQREALEVILHEWRPDGAAYYGAPADLADARARRAQRCVTRRLPVGEVPPLRTAPRGALSHCTLDLRYVPPYAFDCGTPDAWRQPS